MAVVADSCMTWYTLIYCRPPADGTFGEIWTVVIIIVIVKVILSITITIVRITMTMMMMMMML